MESNLFKSFMSSWSSPHHLGGNDVEDDLGGDDVVRGKRKRRGRTKRGDATSSPTLHRQEDGKCQGTASSQRTINSILYKAMLAGTFLHHCGFFKTVSTNDNFHPDHGFILRPGHGELSRPESPELNVWGCVCWYSGSTISIPALIIFSLAVAKWGEEMGWGHGGGRLRRRRAQGRAGGLFTSAAAQDLWGVWIGRHRLRRGALDDARLTNKPQSKQRSAISKEENHLRDLKTHWKHKDRLIPVLNKTHLRKLQKTLEMTSTNKQNDQMQMPRWWWAWSTCQPSSQGAILWHRTYVLLDISRG